ncbi:MAG TPA: hypothetical protein VGO56_21295 [Pyrinomonadaceae bacterium]|jgi:hypothetical protein|nr:hypothetical protein [Pyrinomonadaceae bacterium]
MKRWKKLLLLLLVLIVLSQIPFAYRRYRLGRLYAAIQQVNSQRSQPEDIGTLTEVMGVVHVHSSLGGHSAGTFSDIIAAAQSNQLDFVVMTEHPSANIDTAQLTLNGEHGGVLFLNGNEVRTATGDRLLVIPGDASTADDHKWTTQEVLSRRPKGLAIVAYPQEFNSWEASGYGGVEVYNLYTNARKINPVLMFFDGLWSYRSYPDLLFANFYERPAGNLKLWDEQIKQGKILVGTAGNDAHANIGLSLNDSSGNTVLGFKLDPYERSFRLVRLHVLVSHPFDGDVAFSLVGSNLLAAISAGNCFIGFDLFGDTTGFRYSARDRDEQRLMGDEIKLNDEVKLSVSVPVTGRIVLLKDGVVVQDVSGVNKLEFGTREKGSFRVEVYLPQLPKPASDQPWIISNPIYIR